MDTTEEKLKIETDITNAKRELIIVLSQLSDAKKEASDTTQLKARNVKLIDEQNEYLKTVMNDISTLKLEWAQEKAKELEDLEEEHKKVKEILDRGVELDKQELAIKELFQKNTDIVNDNRRLELKLVDDNTALNVKERELEDAKKEFEIVKNEQDEKVNEIKSKILSILKEIENI